MITPLKLRTLFPLGALSEQIVRQRSIISDIVHKKDRRLLVITGPCSIHNPEEALIIAQRLKKLQDDNPELYIVMRVYGEKPRTALGWKGYINDPLLNDHCNIDNGLLKYRKLLIEISNIGLPIAAEFLDPFLYTYYSDLISWGAIGARSSENQGHRTMASHLGLPIGFKNTSSGSIEIAANSVLASKSPHTFPGIAESGAISEVHSLGNPDGHIILRGDENGPNYVREDILKTLEICRKTDIQTGIIVDFSHGNSKKNHENQAIVCEEISKQISNGEHSIIGVMLESYIKGGNQKYTPGKDNPADIKEGISITDACISSHTLTDLCRDLNQASKTRNIIIK